MGQQTISMCKCAHNLIICVRQIFAQVAAAPEAEGGVALAPPPGDFGGGAGSPGGGDEPPDARLIAQMLKRMSSRGRVAPSWREEAKAAISALLKPGDQDTAALINEAEAMARDARRGEAFPPPPQPSPQLWPEDDNNYTGRFACF